ncbi:uncharacterized protein K02A2.6 [Trichonephila clavipes]|nr:uncharacterized protein K02A2.6 [Trichonephila clavipes]
MYGLNGAPAIWQRYVDGLFQGMDGVKVFMDDARITGSDEISHFTALEEFFKKCREHGLKLNLNKSRRFTLITYHKPLIAIFGSKRGLPVLAATRLLHYALILQSFEFDIIFRKTIEHGNADFLSRLPKTSEELEVKDDITIFQMSQIEALPVTSKELRQETSKDIELGPLLRALREGKDLQGREAQYTIEDGCIMYGQRVCIPRKFDVGDRVAVRVYRAANTRWKFGTIVNQDGVLHYIIDVQGTLVRRHVDQIRSVGIKCKKTSFHLCTRDFHHQRFEKTTLIFSMQKRRKIFLRIGTRNWVHLPYKECHQLMLRFQIYHSLQLKRLTPRRGVHQFQTGHYPGVPGESGGLRRDLFFKEGGDVVYLTVTS